jgi:hypothetical protein
MQLVKMLDGCGRFLDPLAYAQITQRSSCVVHGAMQDVFNCADSLSVQALLRLQRTKLHKRITDELLLLRRHQPKYTIAARQILGNQNAV